MLNSFSQQIRVCLRHAEECAQRARIECDQSIARDFLDMERRWLSVARSYAFSERLEAFIQAQKDSAAGRDRNLGSDRAEDH
jgi:hypothetical protein